MKRKGFRRLLAMALVLAAGAWMSASAEIPANRSCDHQWSLVSSKPATCTEQGLKEYRCSLCGKEKTKKIPALGHKWGTCTIVTRQTCTEDGLIRCFCTRDPSHFEDKVQPAPGHSWGNWTMLKVPTWDEPGLSERKCQRCDSIQEQHLPSLAEQEEYALQLIVFPDPESGGEEIQYAAALVNRGKHAVRVRLEEDMLLSSGQAVWIPAGQGTTAGERISLTLSVENPGGTAVSRVALLGAEKENPVLLADLGSGEARTVTVECLITEQDPTGMDITWIPAGGAGFLQEPGQDIPEPVTVHLLNINLM